MAPRIVNEQNARLLIEELIAEHGLVRVANWVINGAEKYKKRIEATKKGAKSENSRVKSTHYDAFLQSLTPPELEALKLRALGGVLKKSTPTG